MLFVAPLLILLAAAGTAAAGSIGVRDPQGDVQRPTFAESTGSWDELDVTAVRLEHDEHLTLVMEVAGHPRRMDAEWTATLGFHGASPPYWALAYRVWPGAGEAFACSGSSLKPGNCVPVEAEVVEGSIRWRVPIPPNAERVEVRGGSTAVTSPTREPVWLAWWNADTFDDSPAMSLSRPPRAVEIPEGAEPSVAPLMIVAAATAAAGLLAHGAVRAAPWWLLLSRRPLQAPLLEVVRAAPGVTVADLAAALRVWRSTAHYNVRRAEAAGLVVTARIGPHRLVFLPGDLPPGREVAALAATGRRRVAAAIVATPGAHVAAVARAVGIDRSTALRHVRVLEAAGVVDVHGGARARCYPAPTLAALLSGRP